MPKIEQSNVSFETPWFQVISKTVSGMPGTIETQQFFVVKPVDYVSILAVTADNQVLLVRQYRPVVEDYTLEIPSGHVEPGRTAEEWARQELLEETGYVAHQVHFLGTRAPDTGRLGNKIWFFFADGVTQQSQTTEEGIELVRCSMKEFFEFLANGQIIQSFNLALVQLAFQNGLLSPDEMIIKK